MLAEIEGSCQEISEANLCTRAWSWPAFRGAANGQATSFASFLYDGPPTFPNDPHNFRGHSHHRYNIPRVKRTPLNLTAVASLLLSLAIALLWVRTYVAQDQLSWRHGPYFAMAETYAGVVEISLSAWMNFRHVPDGWQFFSGPYHDPYEHLAIHRQRPPPGRSDWDRWLIVLPMWLILLPSALPLVAWWRWHQRAARAGTCPRCGYDLRATPDRCPECGMITGR